MISALPMEASQFQDGKLAQLLESDFRILAMPLPQDSLLVPLIQMNAPKVMDSTLH